VPFVTIVGDDEKANGTVGVKDMRSGEQQMVARADVTNFIKSRVRVS
jgi:histidyl-tRNA synthetase